MNGDPPFGGDDAEALTVSEQMFGFQGSLYKFPPKDATPNLAIFLTDLKGMEGWKTGRAEQAEDRGGHNAQLLGIANGQKGCGLRYSSAPSGQICNPSCRAAFKRVLSQQAKTT
jgi:hypothetical protein